MNLKRNACWRFNTPVTISLFAEIESVDANDPQGMSIHQDLGRFLIETMPDHSWVIESNLREHRFNVIGAPGSEGHLVLVELNTPQRSRLGGRRLTSNAIMPANRSGKVQPDSYTSRRLPWFLLGHSKGRP